MKKPRLWSKNPAPKGCKGCRFLGGQGTCDYHRLMGVSRTKLGVKTLPGDGGCSLYLKQKAKRRTRNE